MSTFRGKAKRARRRERARNRGKGLICNALVNHVCKVIGVDLGNGKDYTAYLVGEQFFKEHLSHVAISGGRLVFSRDIDTAGQKMIKSWDGSEKAKRTPTPKTRWIWEWG